MVLIFSHSWYLMKQLPFYFDFASPYSFLFWKIFQKRSELSSRITLLPKPVFMGSLITHYVDKGPAQIPGKRVFLFKQALRLASIHQIQLLCPAKLPFNPLLALRVATQEASGEDQRTVIDRLFQGIWGDGNVIEDENSLFELLIEEFSEQKARRFVELASSREARLALKTHHRQAIESLVFGVPTVVADNNELFWGVESIDALERWLNGTDHYSTEVFEKFVQVTSVLDD
jgi:2-hydroxychromene-2-carboxylate isomerase